MSARLLHKELSYAVCGILFTVHNAVGRFASEKQVCDLVVEQLVKQLIPYIREFNLPSPHEGEKFGRDHVDFLIDNKIVLEIKYKNYLRKEDYEQIKRYLVVTNLALGILVNFRQERIVPKRILNGSGKE